MSTDDTRHIMQGPNIRGGESLDATWAELEADARRRGGRGLLVRRVAPGAAPDIFLGVERHSSSRVVLVTVPAGSVDTAAMDLACAGIEVITYTLDPGVPAVVTVGVRLAERRYGDVFDALAADLVDHLAAAEAAADAAPALFGRLHRWQQFLRRLDSGGLSAEAQRGLYAELKFLLHHAVPVLGPRRAVAGWAGPSGADQDFRFGRVAVEVKSHAGHQPQEVRISSARQLDGTGLDCLMLYVLSLDARDGAGETLARAVDAIRGVLGTDPVALDTFEGRLLEAGYLDAYQDRYDCTGYTSRSEACFEVRNGFPRIVERDLITGVGSVSYGISPAACTPFALDLRQVPVLLHGGTPARSIPTTVGVPVTRDDAVTPRQEDTDG